jgi:hypothetical protein
MSAPRHLWSGDWRNESSAHGEDLAARRAQAPQPGEIESAPTPSRSARSAADRLRAWLRATRPRAHLRLRPRYPSRRRIRVAVLVGLLALVGAGVAFAASSALIGSGNGGKGQAASGYQPWLGIELYNSPYGGPIVVAVAAGSPAQVAGVEPGDVISEIDGKPVATASEFAAAVAGKHAGDRVALQFERGTVTYVARIRLAARPVAQP